MDSKKILPHISINMLKKNTILKKNLFNNFWIIILKMPNNILSIHNKIVQKNNMKIIKVNKLLVNKKK